MDTSYTLISVPKHPASSFKQMKAQFNFNIKEDQTLIIKMMENTCFLFSGFMLAHYQTNEQN